MSALPQELVDYFGDFECVWVAEMHAKFGFTINLTPTDLRVEVLRQRQRFIQEEVNEMLKAIDEDNFEDLIDALVDAVAVIKGTAVMMGIKWEPHWAEVMEANMAKQRGRNPNRPDQEEDLIKPSGWKAPDHKKVLETYVGT